MAKIFTQHKKLSRKNITNPLNNGLNPKKSTTDFLLNYSKSLETNISKTNVLISLN